MVGVKNHHRGVEKYIKSVIVKRLGPMRYLVKVGTKCRYTHVVHLQRCGQTSELPHDEWEDVAPQSLLEPQVFPPHYSYSPSKIRSQPNVVPGTLGGECHQVKPGVMHQ